MAQIMKKISVLVLALIMVKNIHAQTLEEGIKMYNYNRWQSAQKILAPLAATNARANYYLGLTYLKLSDIGTAETTFKKFPEDIANIAGTAMVAFMRHNNAAAMQILNDMTSKAKKKDIDQYRFAADAIIITQTGDFLQAVQWDSLAFKHGAKDAALFIALGDAYRNISGGGGAAMDNYEHSTDVEKSNSLGFSRIGDLWFDAANYKLALESYSKAKDCDATNPLPYKALADAYWRSGRYDKALENMKQYMKLSDNSFVDKLMNTEIQYQAKDYCNAVASAQSLLKENGLADSTKAELYGILGFSQKDCNDSVGAVANIQKYLGMVKPSKIMPVIYYDFGKLWLRLDNLDSAGRYYMLGLNMDTTRDKTDYYRQIADAYKGKKNYCKSAEWYDNLVKSYADAQASDYAWRSIMSYYCGDYAKTVTTAQEFMKKYPEQPSSYQYAAKGAAAIDSNDTSGMALPFYTQWLDKVGPNYAKKNELKTAYGYIAVYYFNREEGDKADKDKLKDDEDKLAMYKAKLRELDPEDKYLKQIEELEKAQKAQKSAPKQATKPKK